MPEHIQYEDDDLFNPETHHESSDVPVRPLFWFIVIFIVFSVVTHLVISFLYRGFVSAERKRMDPPATAVTRPANADVPQNQPLLQPFPRVDGKGGELPPQADTPVTDLEKMRQREQQQLTSYGWVDRQRGTVHIPIDLAKKTMAARIAVSGASASSPADAAPPVPPATISPSTVAPSGQPVTPDTGVAPATNTGAHQ
jgi:hypothetical protein